jgi:hypothetical protein
MKPSSEKKVRKKEKLGKHGKMQMFRGRMNEEELVRERKQAKTQFQELEKASEYCETHYFNNTNMNNPHTIRPNKFWADFAQHILNQGDTHKFITPKLHLCLQLYG